MKYNSKIFEQGIRAAIAKDGRFVCSSAIIKAVYTRREFRWVCERNGWMVRRNFLGTLMEITGGKNGKVR